MLLSEMSEFSQTPLGLQFLPSRVLHWDSVAMWREAGDWQQEELAEQEVPLLLNGWSEGQADIEGNGDSSVSKLCDE